MIVGYIKNTEDNLDYQKQHRMITMFARDNMLDLSCIYADVSFDNLKPILSTDCEGVIVGNISLIGTSLPSIRDNLYFCREHGLSLYSVAENYKFNNDVLTDEMLRGIDLAIDVRNKMTSEITKKALARKKESGFKLGRAGRCNKRYVLSGRENEVFRLLDEGMPKVQVAKELGVCVASLYNFLNRVNFKPQEKE